MSDVEMRPYRESDKDFIYSSWLKSFVGLSFITRGVPRKIAFDMQKLIAAACLERSEVIVATPKDDSDLILGYVVFERIGGEAVCHYIYVKASYRRLGLARTFLNITRFGEKRPVIATHMTEFGLYLKQENIIYNPFLLMTGDYYGRTKTEHGTIRGAV